MKKDWLSALAALGVICSAGAQSRTFASGGPALTAIQDAPQTMTQSLFPQVTAEEFAALAGGGIFAEPVDGVPDGNGKQWQHSVCMGCSLYC